MTLQNPIQSCICLHPMKLSVRQSKGRIKRSILGHATKDTKKNFFDGCERPPSKRYVWIRSCLQDHVLPNHQQICNSFRYYIAVYLREMIELFSEIKVKASAFCQPDEPKPAIANEESRCSKCRFAVRIYQQIFESEDYKTQRIECTSEGLRL